MSVDYSYHTEELVRLRVSAADGGGVRIAALDPCDSPITALLLPRSSAAELVEKLLFLLGVEE